MKRYILTIILIFILYDSPFGQWEYFGEMPRSVAGAETWQVDGQIYIIGGYSDSLQNSVNWVQIFNPNTRAWSYDSISTPRYGFVVENYDNSAYLFGGIGNESNLLSSIERWKEELDIDGVFSYNTNFNRIFSTGHIIGDNFYIIGGNPLPGTRTDTLPYIIEYNLISDQTTFALDTLFISEDLPEQQMSGVINDNIFIFGGVYNGISQDIFRFDINEHKYEKLDIKLLEPRAGGSAVYHPPSNSIYIIGGYNEDLEPLNTVEIFHAFGDEYYIESGSDITDPRYYFAASYFDGSIYLFGGQNGENSYVSSIEYISSEVATTQDESSVRTVPSELKLFQNYPNPFNPTTVIKFEVPARKGLNNSNIHIKIMVYDVIGNLVATVSDKNISPGIHSVEFSAGNLPSGIYYYQLVTGNHIKTRKMLLLK